MKINCRLLCVVTALTILLGNQVFSADNKTFFGAGKGTKDSPYWVENAEQLQNVKLFPEAYFIQTCDIDTGEKEFSPIGNFEKPFTGNYDGEGHRITVKEIKATDGNIRLAGIWGFTSGAEIKNLIIDLNASLDLEGRVCVGGVAACSNKSIIKSCSVSSDTNIQVTSGKCLYAGGIVGYSAFETSIKNCSFEGKIEGKSKGDIESVCTIGGIVGENRTGSTIKKSTFSENASISGTSMIAPAWVGGIAGFNENSTYVCDCHAVVPMTLKPNYDKQKNIFTQISICNSAGKISGYSIERIAVGGIVGFNAADISNCISQASSKTRGSILKSNNIPSALIGGVTGDNTGIINNSSSLSSIQTLSDGFLAVGGIAGRNSGVLNNCNYYFVSGKGLTNFTAIRSFNLFSVLESVSARGGIAGINDNTNKRASVSNCKVLGNKEEQAIISYGHVKENYGEIIGMQVE